MTHSHEGLYDIIYYFWFTFLHHMILDTSFQIFKFENVYSTELNSPRNNNKTTHQTN